MSEDRPMDTGKPEEAAPVVRIEVDAPDNLDAEQMRVLDALGLSDGEADFEVSPSQQFDSLEDLLEAEQREDEGIEFEWPDLPGSKVLLAHPENAMLAYPQCEREVRAKHKVKADDPLPPNLIMKAAALSAFGRSVKGWNLELAGKPYEFNLVNFLRMWRRRRFRNFLAARFQDFRERPQLLGEESGKN